MNSPGLTTPFKGKCCRGMQADMFFDLETGRLSWRCSSTVALLHAASLSRTELRRVRPNKPLGLDIFAYKDVIFLEFPRALRLFPSV